MNAQLLIVPGASLALLLLAAGCADGGKRRAIGAACDASSQCVSGICGGGQCLDPEADTDGDGLVNRVEAALGTDPVAVDSDGDGVDDSDEVGADVASPVDTDGDGKIDATESATADCDGDGVVDQRDPTDGTDAKGHCGGGGAKDPCVAVCDEAATLGCEGFAMPQCLAECASFSGAGEASPACAAAFRAAAGCLVTAHAFVCNTGEDDFSSFPDADTQSCPTERADLESCDGSSNTCALDPDPLELGTALNLFISADGNFELLEVRPPASAALEVVLTPTSSDPTSFAEVQIDIYDAAASDFCAVNPASGTRIPDDETSGDASRTFAIPGSANHGHIEILLTTAVDARFIIQVNEVAP